MKLVPRKNQVSGFFDDDFFDGFFNFPVRKVDVNNLMKTDVKETEENYLMDIDIPGYDKKDISLSLEDGYLTIKAAKEETTEEKEDEKFIRRERHYGESSRSFYVGDVTEEEINAEYVNGTLKIVIPKVNAKKETKKLIEIK
ncbi:MAG: Hsp20/alpha crystallin family protein [Bacilli bacterium]|nr:Hsp20/alpha crystallin family protein [Bacilli bacterium]